ncbi:hypothetical protein BDL97_18G051400 [Sphagnum fallax]|nr:hypothetical protein BDL97_18G051400 [Sphagnum fallax]KAH9533338.1 hypothetical protein CY35_18G046400 [Sphagnum magellanicum]
MGCCGQTFTYMQVKTIWSVLLCCFELELISPFPEMDRNAMILGVKGKLIVLYK